MSENNPLTPGGSVPPKPPEAAKIQPKKETVRISLPPKPSSSPTIKLPTLPASGPASPTGAPLGVSPPGASPAPAAPRPPTAGSPAPAVAAPVARPPSGTGATISRPPGATAAPTTAPVNRPAPAPVSRKPVLSGLDVGLGIAAAVAGLGAIISLVLLLSLK